MFTNNSLTKVKNKQTTVSLQNSIIFGYLIIDSG